MIKNLKSKYIGHKSIISVTLKNMLLFYSAYMGPSSLGSQSWPHIYQTKKRILSTREKKYYLNLFIDDLIHPL